MLGARNSKEVASLETAYPHPAAAEGLRITIRGTVQGVGMRPFVFRAARAEGIAGRVRNDVRGVTIEAFGAPTALRRFVTRLEAERPTAARFDDLVCEAIPPEPLADFRIVESEPVGAAGPRVSIPADLATCGDCLRELFDPGDRRYRYPFINCTSCGPRFTLARGVPYDRARTTMAPFALCAACRREYEDPGDRRFHAEPNACPACGPHLALVTAGRTVAMRDEALRGAAAALARGEIVAVKGIGGFHLACDATSPAAVEALRLRKHREEKPLAVMVRDLAAAEALAVLADAERALLASVERPIVLARRREGVDVAPGVAPGTPWIGLFLPYSPLHHLLLADVGRPLVLTSGNATDEPIAFRDDDALRRLGPIADHVLLHDREIETRADDSVAKVIAGRPVLLRRSRGYAPRGLRLRRAVERPILGCGAHLKNTFCIAVEDAAHLGPHIGDLENLETIESLESAVARMERFLRARPAALAHDLHPGYASTRYALARASAEGLPSIAVQHHHAHAAAAMAEHGLEGPVLALAWDGTGLGDDGAAWGGELLVATRDSYRRLATFRPVALAGGDAAIRQPWRVALAALLDAFEGAPPVEALALFRRVRPPELAAVRQMLAQGFRSPLAHGAGRAFDAVGALALERPTSRYEGQVAVALDAAADPAEAARYPFAIDDAGAPWQLDLRPLYRAVAADLLAGVPAGTIAARFHNALVGAGGELLRMAAARAGSMPVVLTGGCFANARLAEGIAREAAGVGAPHLHGDVPPGDGGVALGQVVVADARLRRG
jgi:hydrogenase maturation protein HypF